MNNNHSPSNRRLLLINPPLVKPSEPPAGPAKLAGFLHENDVDCRIWDANIEGILHLLNQPQTVKDTWTDRSYRHRQKNRELIKHRELYINGARYRRVVSDLNRILRVSARHDGIILSLANYEDRRLSPVKSDDLLKAAEAPQNNPFYGCFQNRLTDILDHEAPNLIGFSINYLSQALCAFAMIGFLRSRHPSLKIVLGGGLITSWMRRPGWRSPFAGLVDDMVAGPGEDALLSLAGKTASSRNTLPDYRLFPTEDYFAPGFILPYSASSGCYWRRCSFCPEKAEDNPYTTVSPKEVVKNLRTLTEQTKPALIHLLDNAVSPAHLQALIDQPPGAPWYGFVRMTPHLADPEFCSALKKSGCVMLKIGLESGDQGVLDALQKGIDLDVARKALKSIKKAGIATYIYLLFGTPAESLPEAGKTLDFTVRHIDEIDFLNLAVFNLPAYGPDADSLPTSPFYEGDLSLYRAFEHPAGWNRGQVRQFLDKEFKRHPAIAAILKNDPPFFTSNHAPFFNLED
ncbi:MAG: radical SAM protein [Deltaproteobacteria bacterium]|nr:radical SAM protein [Deltaproteobacteria bacterium]